MRILAIVLLAAAMGAGTLFLGWWSVPLLAAAYALLTRDERAPRESAFAALVTWAALLIRLTGYSAFASLLAQLGQIFPVPGAVVAALTLLLAVVLASTAARLVVGIVGVRQRD